jgi:hypothetical protein
MSRSARKTPPPSGTLSADLAALLDQLELREVVLGFLRGNHRHAHLDEELVIAARAEIAKLQG